MWDDYTKKRLIQYVAKLIYTNLTNAIHRKETDRTFFDCLCRVDVDTEFRMDDRFSTEAGKLQIFNRVHGSGKIVRVKENIFNHDTLRLYLKLDIQNITINMAKLRDLETDPALQDHIKQHSLLADVM